MIFSWTDNPIFISCDAGRLRTIDENGNVVTILGQPLFFGDGQLALSARFGPVSMIDQANDGSVFVLDPHEIRLRKFQNGGTIQTIAGNGSAGGALMNTTPAINQPILTATPGGYEDSFAVNPATGDVFMSQGPNNIAMLSHTTGLWTAIAAPDPNSFYPVGVYGFDGVNVSVDPRV